MIPSQFQPIANHLWQFTLFVLVAGLLTLDPGAFPYGHITWSDRFRIVGCASGGRSSIGIDQGSR